MADASPASRAQWLGIGLTVAGAVLFSAKAIVIKLSYHYPVDPVSLQALRMTVALPLYLLVAAFFIGPRVALSGGDRWLIAGLGLLGYYVASVLDLGGLQYVTAAMERLVLYVYPTLVLLYGRVLFGRRVSRTEWIAVAISYAGLAVVFGGEVGGGQTDVWLGGGLVLASAAAYAGFMVGSGRLIPRVGSVRFTCYAMSAAALGVATHFLLTRPLAVLDLPAPAWGLVVTLAVACTLLPSLLLAAGIARLGAERVALLGMVGPVSTLILGSWLLDEPFGLPQLAGTLLILAGVGYLSLGRRAAPAAAPAPARA